MAVQKLTVSRSEQVALSVIQLPAVRGSIDSFWKTVRGSITVCSGRMAMIGSKSTTWQQSIPV